jgi:hypothetical protein
MKRSFPITNRGGIGKTYEAFPKLQFWESNFKIRRFARLKA